ncbi:MAG: hypothetical protein WBA17_03075, partial [Saprospiraceae bacterium]
MQHISVISLRRFVPAIALVLFGNLVLSAQPIPDGSVDVVTSFEAALIEAERVLITPELPAADTAIRRQQYNVVTRVLDAQYLPPTIRPRGFGREKNAEVYNGYFRFGLGNPNAFLGDLSYDLITEESFDLGIKAHHYSFNNNKNIENQRASDTDIGIDGTYYFDQGFAVEAGLRYNTTSQYYYGYNELNENRSDSAQLSFEPDEVRQRFNLVDLEAAVFNGTRTERDFNYRGGVKAYILDDSYAARENGFQINLQATKWFNDVNPLDIQLITDFTTFKDTTSQSLNNFYFMPSYTLHGEQFRVKIGLNLTSSEDNFKVFPNLEASAEIIPGAVGAFIGTEGSLQKNTMRSLTEYNPFTRTRFRIRNATYNRFYGGLRGNVAGITYRGEIAYKAVDNLALYRAEQGIDIPRFRVEYDTAKIV